MAGVVEGGHAAVAPVHRQEVLHQVVGADAEEVALARQLRGDQGRRGDLNHRAKPDRKSVV